MTVIASVLCLSSVAAPLNVDLGRQLFVDDCLIASTAGIVRVYNHPVKAFTPVAFAGHHLL